MEAAELSGPVQFSRVKLGATRDLKVRVWRSSAHCVTSSKFTAGSTRRKLVSSRRECSGVEWSNGGQYRPTSRSVADTDSQILKVLIIW
jgi:hypothetical protein